LLHEFLYAQAVCRKKFPNLHGRIWSSSIQFTTALTMLVFIHMEICH
jgi:hypothetical protein